MCMGWDLNKLRKAFFCIKVKISHELLIPLTTKYRDPEKKNPTFLVHQPYQVHTENWQIEQYLNNLKVLIEKKALKKLWSAAKHFVLMRWKFRNYTEGKMKNTQQKGWRFKHQGCFYQRLLGANSSCSNFDLKVLLLGLFWGEVCLFFLLFVCLFWYFVNHMDKVTCQENPHLNMWIM